MFVLQYGRGLRNFHAEQPHQHAVYFTSVLMSELLWTQEELLDALEGQLHDLIIVKHFSSHQPGFQFLGHRQAVLLGASVYYMSRLLKINLVLSCLVQSQIISHKMWHLNRVFTVCLQDFLSKVE